MFFNHIWQEFLLQYLLPCSCDFSPFQLASFWIVCIFSSPWLCPHFLHLKHSFPTPQYFKILPQRLAQTLTNSPMNCSLIPSIGATVSFLQGPLKKYLTRSYHGMVSSTPNTLMLWQHSPSIIPCPANIYWAPTIWQLMGTRQWTQSRSSPSEGSHSVVVGGNHNPTWGLSLVGLGLSIPGFYSWMPFSEVCGAWAWPS